MFCRLQVQDGLNFFASKVLLGTEGVEKILPLGNLNDFETKAVEALVPELQGSVKKGVEFAANGPAPASS